MGDYLTLKFKAELTDAGRDVVADLIKLWNGDRDAWVTAIEAAPDVFYSRRSNPFLADYRRNFIPFGAVPYPPEHMEDLWCKNVNRLTAHTWSVVCSVKTQSTIDNFLTGVLPYILEANCLAKTWGEESSEPVEQLIKPRRRTILYC